MKLSPDSLARFSSRRPWIVVGAWLAMVAAAFALIATQLSTALTTEVGQTNNPESERAAALIDERLGESERSTDVVIVRSDGATVDDPAFREKVESLATELSSTFAVADAETYYELDAPALVSEDRRATLIPLRIRPETEDEGAMPELIDVVQGADTEPFDVTITGEYTAGYALETQSQEDLKEGEFFFGAPAALIILLLVFGTVVGAMVPLLMAIVAIIVTLGITAAIGQQVEFSFFVVNMVTGMGLALGIDYSLFVLSRYREERRGGLDKLAAIEASGATASRAVLFSGLAFVLALLGMFLVPDLILRSLAAGAVIVGIVSLVAALTLLPAILGLLGDRVNSLPVPVIGRTVAEQAGTEGRFWGRIVRGVLRRPVLSLVLSAGLLVAAAIPIVDYDTGFAGTATLPGKTAAKQGYDAMKASFPEASAEPVLVAIDADVSSSDVRGAMDRLSEALAADPRFGEPSVQAVPERQFALMSVPHTGDSQTAEAVAAASDVREEFVPDAFQGVDANVLVGGQAADTADYKQTTGFWMPWIFAFVLGLSLVLLTIAFRSIVVAAKAILLNLLSVGAAYGLLVLVFVKGVGADFLGLQQVDTIVAWVPLFLFSVLFGLSMDYHVFLLSRIRERFIATGDNDLAVEQGVTSTARLITGAALIIIAVFTGFALGDLVMFQQMGFGIAVALLIDATIIRSILVPATMKLLGTRNWYLPSWLRWLPDVHVEGARHPVDDTPVSTPAR